MRPIQQILTFISAVDDSVATSQTPDSITGDVTLNGVLVSGGVATMEQPVPITLTSTDNLSTYTFDIAGTDPDGNVITENVTGPNNDTVTTTNTFATVTGITSDAIGLTTETVSAGTSGWQTGPTAWWPLDIYNPNTATSCSATIVDGTATYSFEYTNEDPWDNSITQQVVNHPDANLVGASTDQTGFTFTLMRAVRVNITGGAGTLRVTVTQQSTV